ncbi:hypothetical protein SAMN05518845_11514 [Variovorax sp. YR750]|nr:hypothetical protein SAMN05518845_11514 [Variovorax sp. YR750]
MAGVISGAISNATTEWTKWGGHAWDLRGKAPLIPKRDKDDDATRAQYVLDTYCPAAGAMPAAAAIQDDQYAWSAVFISYLFMLAGYQKTEFPFSENHSTWIRKAVKAGAGTAKFNFHAFRVTDPRATPQVGDLIAYARPDKDGQALSFDEAQKWFTRTSSYKSHSDLVVAASPGAVEVIGGNVRDSVMKKVVPLDASGRIADRSLTWFAVLRYQGI